MELIYLIIAACSANGPTRPGFMTECLKHVERCVTSLQDTQFEKEQKVKVCAEAYFENCNRILN